AASTEILHLRDTDGDGRADSKQVVLSGFGTEDTHHIIHTFRWGPEQLLYFKQSVYIHSHVETPWGVERLNAGGTWRFRPENWRLSVFDRGLVNSWGLDFDDYGTTFATDGAGGEGINYVVPGASYLTAYGADRILRGLNPGSPKHCGLEIVGGRHLPADWEGSFVTSDFRGHRVCRFKLTESGSGFVSQEQQEVIKSDHVAFRPVDTKMGPDGALYIADWYNPIIQHGEVDFRDERRDHTHGRIWRVTYRGNPLVERPQLIDGSHDELVAQLASPEAWTRNQAKRLLKERGPDVLPAVKRWSRNLDNTAPGYHRLRLEALWVYQSLDVVEGELLESLLRCLDHNARAAACRVVGDWHARLDDPIALLTPRATDEHPRVRLEAVRALAQIPHPHSIEIAMRALDPDVPSLSKFMPVEIRQANQPVEKRVDVDEWLDYALWLAARDLQPIWQPALLAGDIDFGGNARHLTFVLKSAGSVETVPLLTKLLNEGRVSEDEREDVLAVITAHAGPGELRELLALAAASDDVRWQSAILDALLDAKRRRNVVPGGDYQPLEQLLNSGDSHVVVSAALCVGAFQVERLWPALKSMALDAFSVRIRVPAINGIAAYGGEEAETLLVDMVHHAEPPAIRIFAAEALMPLRPDIAAPAAVAHTQRFSHTTGRFDRIMEVVLRHETAVKAMTEALAAQTLPSDTAVVALRIVNSSGQTVPELTEALRKAGGITSGPRQLSSTEMRSLVNDVSDRGNPAAGERVYRRQDLNCIKCHAIGGAGGLVGPDMLSLGTTAQLDYIIDALLDPNKQMKENYHTQVVVTDKGLTISGIVVRQTDRDLILRDAEGREQSVPLDSIELRKEGASLMPAGLADKLTHSELVNLVAFLKALGRLPEFTVTPSRVARKWEVLQPTDQAADRIRRVGDFAAAEDDPAFRWEPVYSRVDGSLPAGELPPLNVGGRQVCFARVHVESDVEGASATLVLRKSREIVGWWNGGPLELGNVTADTLKIDVALHKGRNRLTLSVTPATRQADLRVELRSEAAVVRFGD
ncbi:MAG: HEAT repeat domain-containing protein, partial [Planctomycetaceae bacterium]